MTPEELFTAALGLGQQWRVVECRFEGEPKRLEHVRGQHFECPQCGTLCGVHDTVLVQIFLRVCFCPGEKALQSLGREDQCPEFRSGGCFSGQWFEVELLFLDFLCQLNAANRHGRRLESLEPEHRLDPLLYSPVILLDHVVQIFAGSHVYAAR